MARRNQSQFLQRLWGVGVAARVLGVESVRGFATVNLGTPRVFTPQFCTHWRWEREIRMVDRHVFELLQRKAGRVERKSGRRVGNLPVRVRGLEALGRVPSGEGWRFGVIAACFSGPDGVLPPPSLLWGSPLPLSPLCLLCRSLAGGGYTRGRGFCTRAVSPGAGRDGPIPRGRRCPVRCEGCRAHHSFGFP